MTGAPDAKNPNFGHRFVMSSIFLMENKEYDLK